MDQGMLQGLVVSDHIAHTGCDVTICGSYKDNTPTTIDVKKA